MVQIGDVIRLRRSAFENEFLDSDWNVKYMYEDVFKYVSLRFKKLNQPGDMAKTFFGSSDTIVEDIECVYENEPFILLTDLFRIIYPSALENKEINVLSSAEDSLKPLKVQEKLISDLEFFEMNYLEGIFNVMERENNKIATYRTGFYMIKNEGKWSSRK